MGGILDQLESLGKNYFSSMRDYQHQLAESLGSTETGTAGNPIFVSDVNYQLLPSRIDNMYSFLRVETKPYYKFVTKQLTRTNYMIGNLYGLIAENVGDGITRSDIFDATESFNSDLESEMKRIQEEYLDSVEKTYTSEIDKLKNLVESVVEEQTDELSESIESASSSNYGNQKSFLGSIGNLIKNAAVTVGSTVANFGVDYLKHAQDLYAQQDERVDTLMKTYNVSLAEAREISRKEMTRTGYDIYRRYTKQQEMERTWDAKRSAIDLGFTSADTINKVASQIREMDEIMPGLNFQASELYLTVMNGLDKTGNTTQALFDTIRQTSKNLMADPQILMNTSNSFVKYFKLLKRNTLDFQSGMIKVIQTTGKLEDNFIDAQDAYSKATDFGFATLDDITSAQYQKNVLLSRYSQYDFLQLKNLARFDPSEYVLEMQRSLKAYLHDMGINSADDMSEKALYQMKFLGITGSEVIDALNEGFADLEASQEKLDNNNGVDDYNFKVLIDAEEDQWNKWNDMFGGYVPEWKKKIEQIDNDILSNPLLRQINDDLLTATYGIKGVGDAASDIRNFIIGGGLLLMLSKLFSPVSSLFGRGGSVARGAGSAREVATEAAAGGSLLGNIFRGVTSKGVMTGAGGTAGNIASVAAPLAGVAWGGFDAYNVTKNYMELMGQDSSVGGTIGSAIGGFLGGNTGYGIFDEDKSIIEKVGGLVGGAGKGALIGSIGGPLGIAIGAGIGAIASGIGGETIAEAFMTQEELNIKHQRMADKRNKELVDSNINLMKKLDANGELVWNSMDEVRKSGFDKLTKGLSVLNDSQKEMLSKSLDDGKLTRKELSDLGIDLNNNEYQVLNNTGMLSQLDVNTNTGADSTKGVLKLLNERSLNLDETTGVLIGTIQDWDPKEGYKGGYYKLTNTDSSDDVYSKFAKLLGVDESSLNSQQVSDLYSALAEDAKINNNTKFFSDTSYAAQAMRSAVYSTDSFKAGTDEGLQIATSLNLDTQSTRSLVQSNIAMADKFAKDKNGQIVMYNGDNSIPYVDKDFTKKMVSGVFYNAKGEYKGSSDLGGKATFVYPIEKSSDVLIEYDNGFYKKLNKSAATKLLGNKGTLLGSVSSLSNDYSNLKSIPKHAGGLSRVPYDNYEALLHKDERVLSASENKIYTDSIMNGGFSTDTAISESLKSNNQTISKLANSFLSQKSLSKEQISIDNNSYKLDRLTYDNDLVGNSLLKQNNSESYDLNGNLNLLNNLISDETNGLLRKISTLITATNSTAYQLSKNNDILSKLQVPLDYIQQTFETLMNPSADLTITTENDEDNLNHDGGGNSDLNPYAKYGISSGFGKRNLFGRSFHKGTDYRLPMNTKILSPASGTVTINSTQGSKGYGNWLEIQGDNGYRFRFGHMSQRSPLQVGARVSYGDVLGLSGNTGDSTGPHLHFEVRKKTANGTYEPMDDQKYWGTADSIAGASGKGGRRPTSIEELLSAIGINVNGSNDNIFSNVAIETTDGNYKGIDLGYMRQFEVGTKGKEGYRRAGKVGTGEYGYGAYQYTAKGSMDNTKQFITWMKSNGFTDVAQLLGNGSISGHGGALIQKWYSTYDNNTQRFINAQDEYQYQAYALPLLNTYGSVLNKLGPKATAVALGYQNWMGAGGVKSVFNRMGSNLNNQAFIDAARSYIRSRSSYSRFKTGWENRLNSDAKYLGVHRTGLSYVPYDGYQAILHQGEEVLTKPEAEVYKERNLTAMEAVLSSQTGQYVGYDVDNSSVVNAISVLCDIVSSGFSDVINNMNKRDTESTPQVSVPRISDNSITSYV